MSEEKELNQLENDEPESDSNFVELDDLQSLEGLDDLSGLGDLSDLDEQMPLTEENIPEVADISLDHLDIPGLDDITGIDIEEPTVPENSMEDTSDKESDNDSEEIDSMLEGLLDSLDVNGSIDVPEDGEDISIVTGTTNNETITDVDVESENGNLNTESSGVETLEILEEADASEPNTPKPNALEPTDDNIEPEKNADIDVNGMLDDLMMSHNPDFMDALGLDINGEKKTPEDEQKKEERKQKKEKQRKRLKKGKEELEQGEEEKVKRPGFFKRIFGNVVTEEIAEAERQAKIDEEEKAKLKAEEKVKDQQEKQAKKEEKAEEKRLKKEANAAKKAQKAEEKAAKKAQKAAKKAAEKEAEEKEIVGKLNKPGVIIVVIGAVIILAGVVVGTNVFGYRLTKSETEKYLQLDKYSDAYREVIGSKLKKKDPDGYERIVTIMKVQQSLDTYSSYTAMKYYPDALNALLRGLQKYDENIETARDLEVDGDLKACKDKILRILNDEFGLSESQAYAILRLDSEAYINKVVNIAKKKI